MDRSSFSKVFESLTLKQASVLDLAIQHMTSKQIARELKITPKTADRRIEGIRSRLGNIPRSDLLRNYSAWLEDGGKSPRGISLLTPASRIDPNPTPQPEVAYKFEDSLVFDERASWDAGSSWQKPEIELEKLGPGVRIVMMLVGAVAIMALVVLTFTATTALTTLLGN